MAKTQPKIDDIKDLKKATDVSDGLMSKEDKEKLDDLVGVNTGDEDTTTIGSLINGATAKITPVDDDMVGLMDSEASSILKKLSWSNIKATLETYFDALYAKLSFANIKVGAVDVVASRDSTVEFIAGTNVSLTADNDAKTITIAATGGGGGGGIQTVTLASGTDAGTLKLTVDGDTEDNIPVEGLGSAAYEATSAFATAAQGDLANSSLQPIVINDLLNDYLPKWDDTNNKFIDSLISDDGTTPKYGDNKIWHSGNDGSLSELDADLLDGKHASDFATSTHNHDTTYLKLTGGVLSGNVNPNTDNYVILGASTLRYKAIYAAQFMGNATTATHAISATNATNATTANGLRTSRKINGVYFDGTADITIPGNPETIQPLTSGGNTLNTLSDGIYQLNSTLPTSNYPDSVCGTILGSIYPNGTEILRQYTVSEGGKQFKTQIMLIQNETYRRSGIGTSWNEWVRLITCRDMADYVTTDMLETSDGEYLEPDVPVNVYRDTTYTIDGEAKEGKYIIELVPLFTNPPLEIIETYIAMSPESSGDYTLEIQLSDFDIDTRESSSSTTGHSTVSGYAWITIPAGTSVVLLKIYMFSNISRCIIVYTLS